MTNQISCTFRLNATHRCHSNISLFRGNSSWGNSRQFHEKLLALTLTQDCTLQTAGVITKEGYENRTHARPLRGKLAWIGYMTDYCPNRYITAAE